MMIKLDGVTEPAPVGCVLHDVTSKVGHTCLRFGFPNGYTASIVRGPCTYGGDEGKFEGAVVHEKQGIVYDTPITSDVEGWLSAQAAVDFILKVAALPVRE